MNTVAGPLHHPTSIIRKPLYYGQFLRSLKVHYREVPSYIIIITILPFYDYYDIVIIITVEPFSLLWTSLGPLGPL